jgi:hypothetical protein
VTRLAATVAARCLAIAGLVAAPALAPACAQTPPPAPDLTARIARAEGRLEALHVRATRLADYDELRNLQQIYGYYLDKALWDQVLDLFADDATLEVAQNGVYDGKPAIGRYLRSLTGGKAGLAAGQLNNHLQLSPVITLAEDGRSASARWRLLLQDGVWGDATGGNWGSGVYENQYVKQNGVWKIAKLQLFLRFYAPYHGGWTQGTPAATARYGRSTVKPNQPSPARPVWPARSAAPFHYDNPGTGDYRLTAGSSTTPPPPAGTSKTVPDLEARVRALELRLDRLKSVEDVENLENTYGYYADKSQQDAISALFADNATLEILGRGVFVGSGRIYEYMRRLGAPTPGTLFNHMQLQPVVHISDDGATAEVRARLMVMFATAERAAQWGDGIYENSFVRENGVWKYRALRGYQGFYANYDDGWTRHSPGMLSPFPGYPPDLPQSVAYDAYPAPFVPPFHYANPVTGRQEQVSPQKK